MRINSNGRYTDSRIQDAVRKMYSVTEYPWSKRAIDWAIAEGGASDAWVECFLKTDPKELFDVCRWYEGPCTINGENILNSITEYFEKRFSVNLEADYIR